MYSSESRRTPSDMGILTSATTTYDVVAARALPGAISANTSEQSSRTVEPRTRMSSPPQGRVACYSRRPAGAREFRGIVISANGYWYFGRVFSVRAPLADGEAGVAGRPERSGPCIRG